MATTEICGRCEIDAPKDDFMTLREAKIRVLPTYIRWFGDPDLKFDGGVCSACRAEIRDWRPASDATMPLPMNGDI